MKPREPRRKVLIDARLRQDCGWSDARILNISRRGLMARAPKAPPRGAYVELYRGTHRVVARVVWAQHELFGARAQDAIALDAIAGGKAAPPAPAKVNDRRRARHRPALAERQERNRRWSRRFEFFCVTALGGIAAYFAFDTVGETLARPLNLVEATLGARH